MTTFDWPARPLRRDGLDALGAYTSMPAHPVTQCVVAAGTLAGAPAAQTEPAMCLSGTSMLDEQGRSRWRPGATVAHRPTAATGQPRLDIGPVVEAIARELGGAVAAERIEMLLHELLEREFSDVRITTFLPIFLRRAACDTLRRELQSQAGSRSTLSLVQRGMSLEPGATFH
jgi:hypothetical protein